MRNVTMFAAVAAALLPAQKAGVVYSKSGNGVFGYKDTPKQPWSAFLVHDPDRPEPPRVAAAGVPSDAIVLFDGKDLAQFRESKWKVEDGYVQVTGGDLCGSSSSQAPARPAAIRRRAPPPGPSRRTPVSSSVRLYSGRPPPTAAVKR